MGVNLSRHAKALTVLATSLVYRAQRSADAKAKKHAAIHVLLGILCNEKTQMNEKVLHRLIYYHFVCLKKCNF